MGNAQNCTFVQATPCPGWTGPSPLWVNKALLSSGLLGGGGSFQHNGICYSISANAQPQKPIGGSYASAAYMGGSYSSCSACPCAVFPNYLCFPLSGGSDTIMITGAQGQTWSATVSCPTGSPVSISPSSGTIPAGGSQTITVTCAAISNPAECTISFAGCTTTSVTVGIADPICDPSKVANAYKIVGAPSSVTLSCGCYASPTAGPVYKVADIWTGGSCGGTWQDPNFPSDAQQMEAEWGSIQVIASVPWLGSPTTDIPVWTLNANVPVISSVGGYCDPSLLVITQLIWVKECGADPRGKYTFSPTMSGGGYGCQAQQPPSAAPTEIYVESAT